MAIAARFAPTRPAFSDRARSLLPLALLLGACENPPAAGGKKDKDEESAVRDSYTADSPVDSEPEPVEERCNGLDDDGDGEVDEGFDDVDGDGFADCLECEVEARPAATVTVNGECSAAGPVEDPWDIVLEWEVALPDGFFPWVPFYAMDLDGDGNVEIVGAYGLSGGGEQVLVVDGSSGEVNFTIGNTQHGVGVQLADIDGDSAGEIITVVEDPWSGHLIAFNARGELKWRSEEDAGSWVFAPLVTDLDVNGEPEIVVGGKLHDGATGRLIAEFDGMDYGTKLPAVGDIDGDGRDEIMMNDCLRNEHLEIEWCVEGSLGDGAPLMADVDGDGAGELILLGENFLIYGAGGRFSRVRRCLARTTRSLPWRTSMETVRRR
jgi:hypothetical protein